MYEMSLAMKLKKILKNKRLSGVLPVNTQLHHFPLNYHSNWESCSGVRWQ